MHHSDDNDSMIERLDLLRWLHVSPKGNIVTVKHRDHKLLHRMAIAKGPQEFVARRGDH